MEGLPEGLFGFTQATQYNLHISHGKGAGNHKHLVAQSLHVLHPGAHGLEGGFQVAGGPMGEFQRDGGLGAEVKIVLGDELKGQFGVFHGFGQIALYLGVVGADQGNVPQQGL